jgi:anthranilate phosphoribosyltransferase
VGAILTALRANGETAEELRGFAVGLREIALEPGISGHQDAVDVVGTGGDGSNSLNLSTGAAILAAACGQPIIKHGNRSVSSESGSADVLDALGVGIPEFGAAGSLIDRTGFTFLFAPYYHPAMKAVGPVRQALGVRTIFNLVGPLANPAQPVYSVMGAASLTVAGIMAEALSGMNIERAFVIHGQNGWDEPTPVSPYHLLTVTPGSVSTTIEDPIDFGIARCDASDLIGGTAQQNAASLREALNGKPGPHRQALELGASLALRVNGLVADRIAALKTAQAAIDDGRAATLLEQLQDTSVAGNAT